MADAHVGACAAAFAGPSQKYEVVAVDGNNARVFGLDGADLVVVRPGGSHTNQADLERPYTAAQCTRQCYPGSAGVLTLDNITTINTSPSCRMKHMWLAVMRATLQALPMTFATVRTGSIVNQGYLQALEALAANNDPLMRGFVLEGCILSISRAQ